MKGVLIVAVLMPLWSFYLVKVYAWRTMLSSGGIINWALDPIGIDGPGYGTTAVWLVESYLWLPFMILPIYAGLERIPDSMFSASEDLAASRGRRSGGSCCCLHFPPWSPARSSPSRSPWATTSRPPWSPPTRSSSATSSSPTTPTTCRWQRRCHGADPRHGRLPADRAQARRLRAPMRLSPATRNLLRTGVGITLAFIYIPLVVVAIYAFNGGTTLKWPLDGLTTEWFGKALENDGARDALWTSVRVGAAATAIALVLGTLASFAVARYRFFGRETVSFLVILPIALPGIVTGVALSETPSPRCSRST